MIWCLLVSASLVPQGLQVWTPMVTSNTFSRQRSLRGGCLSTIFRQGPWRISISVRLGFAFNMVLAVTLLVEALLFISVYFIGGKIALITRVEVLAIFIDNYR